jgi:pyridoxamine 5'-phosphate oxidase
LNRDPFELFNNWYDEAGLAPLFDRNAVALATSTKGGSPSVRMVLFRGIREGGFSFFTNYESRKGRELSENPLAALTFYWPHLGKQVRVEGPVQKISSEESDRYFQSRPFDSQLSAMMSPQSRVLDDFKRFQEEMSDAARSLTGQTLRRPENWGGYAIIPTRIEFWTHGEFRRHERVVYEKSAEGWNVSRLYP